MARPVAAPAPARSPARAPHPGPRHPRQGPPLPPRPRTVARSPNDVWTLDFKGWFRTGDGTRVEPLTVRDLKSRFLLDARLLPNQSDLPTRRALARVFGRYGLPKVIRVDNGPPFGGSARAGFPASRSGGGGWAFASSLAAPPTRRTMRGMNKCMALIKPQSPTIRRDIRRRSNAVPIAGGPATTHCGRTKRWACAPRRNITAPARGTCPSACRSGFTPPHGASGASILRADSTGRDANGSSAGPSPGKASGCNVSRPGSEKSTSAPICWACFTSRIVRAACVPRANSSTETVRHVLSLACPRCLVPVPEACPTTPQLRFGVQDCEAGCKKLSCAHACATAKTGRDTSPRTG